MKIFIKCSVFAFDFLFSSGLLQTELLLRFRFSDVSNGKLVLSLTIPETETSLLYPTRSIDLDKSLRNIQPSQLFFVSCEFRTSFERIHVMSTGKGSRLD